MESKFSDERLMRLATQSVEFGSGSLERNKHLTELGFVRHNWYANRAKALCTEQEWTLSQNIAVEEAKEIAGSYGSNPLPLHQYHCGYKSPLLEKLRAERANSGLDREWFGSGMPDHWRYYLGPAAQKLEKIFSSNDAQANTFRSILLRSLEEATQIEESNLKKRYAEYPFWENVAFDEVGDVSKRQSFRGVLIDFITDRFKGYGLVKQASRSIKWTTWVRRFSKKMDLRVIFGSSGGGLSWNVVVCCSELPQRPDGTLDRLFLDSRFFEFRLVDATLGASVYRRYSSEIEFTGSVLAFCELTCFEWKRIEAIVEETFGKVD